MSRRNFALALLGSLAASRTVATFLYETDAPDPAIYVAGAAARGHHDRMSAAGRRAAQFDPMAALRRE